MSPQPLNSSQSGASQKLKFVPAGVLIERRREIDDLIARRAYEIFERRGAVHGHELEDLPEALVLKAEMPGDFTADELELSIEPRRLMVSGNRIVDAIYGDQRGGHFERIPERIFHVHELPVEIDPSRTTAALQAGTLEVIMPKARRRIEP